MAKTRRRQQNPRNGTSNHPRNGTIGPVLRPLAWSALLGAAVAVAFATPVYADPARPGTVPDAGAIPTPAGALQLPGGPPPVTGPVVPPSGLLTGPLATEINAKQLEVDTLGDQLLRLRQERDLALAQLTAAQQELDAAKQTLARAREDAEAVAAEALKDAAALPPGAFNSDLHGLSTLSDLTKGVDAGADTDQAAREVARARTTQDAAQQALDIASIHARNVDAEFTALQSKHQQAEDALRKLKEDNAARVAAIERAQEALDQRLGAQFNGGESIDGKVANPRALAAVRYALAQLGDPYVWGAEGPDRFDCSGLMWAAYRSKGADYYDLPRVANDQYYATRGRTVSRTALLPGDLLFFASGSNWQSIHHVGMYIGGGKMVHAPTTGDVVKISPVWWSHFYAATRIFDPVDAPGAPRTTPATPGSTPTTHPTGTPTPTPAPTGKPAPTTVPSGGDDTGKVPASPPSPTGSATSSPPATDPSTSEGASLSPDTSSSGSTSPSPSPTGSTSPSGSTSGDTSATATG